MKRIIGVYRNQQMHWVGDGFPVKNLFSYDRLGQAISPFLLLDYAAPYHFNPTTAQHGVGSHPHRGIESKDIPVVNFADDAGHIRVIAGSHADHTGPASTYSPVNVWDGALKTGFVEHIHVPVDHNTLVVVLEGEMLLNGTQKVMDSSIVMFARDNEPTIQLEATQDAKFLVLTGLPLNEPIQGHGPFVMNTKDEIVQAFHDFNAGKFGQISA